MFDAARQLSNVSPGTYSLNQGYFKTTRRQKFKEEEEIAPKSKEDGEIG